MDAEKMMKKLDAAKIKFSVVGSYALLSNGYKVKANDVDFIVEKKDVEKASSLLSEFKDAEVYEGKPRSRIFTPEEYRDLFISKFVVDDLMIEKLARHAIDEPRIMPLFENTEIIFVLESMKKDIERKLKTSGQSNP
jgi:hypothetical protein